MIHSPSSPARLIPVLVAFAIACGGGGSGPTSPPAPAAFATVAFVYQAATILDPDVQQDFPGCVLAVGGTHIHPGWQGFNRLDMMAAGDRWQITLNDVPVNREQRIRISDPNGCRTDPNGASTTNVFANGVLLTRIVDTPGNGTEPGLAFTVAADGTVTP